MAITTLSNTDVRDKWREGMHRLETAEEAYAEYVAATDPLFELQASFEARHGLVPPGNGRVATPDYFEKRKALFMDFPEYRVPDIISEALEKFVDVIVAAQSELMRTPSPDLAALRWKLKHTAGAAWSDEYIEQMQADIDALMAEA